MLYSKTLKLITTIVDKIHYLSKPNNRFKIRGIFVSFDITTESKFIECKDVDWSTMTKDQMHAKLAIYAQKANIATQYNKIFELHSKQPLPNFIKTWLTHHDIKFYEG